MLKFFKNTEKTSRASNYSYEYVIFLFFFQNVANQTIYPLHYEPAAALYLILRYGPFCENFFSSFEKNRSIFFEK